MQSSLSQPSMVLSGTAIHNFPAVQHQELAKAQSGLAFQQTSNTQPIPILYLGATHPNDLHSHSQLEGFPGGTSGKGPACQCRRHKRCRFNPWVGKSPRRRAWQPAPVFLPGESHGQRSLVAGYSPRGHKESDTSEATWRYRICL